MITITLFNSGKPSNDRAIAFAKALTASKKQMEEEMRTHYNSPEIQAVFEKLKQKSNQNEPVAV